MAQRIAYALPLGMVAASSQRWAKVDIVARNARMPCICDMLAPGAAVVVYPPRQAA